MVCNEINTFLSFFRLVTVDDQKIQPEATVGNTAKSKNSNFIKVPKIYWDLTRKAVLTMEWIDGIKLTDEAGLNKACLDRRKLVDQVISWCKMLCLDMGQPFILVLTRLVSLGSVKCA